MLNLSFGADPEVFLRNTEGALVPSCGLIGGDKHNGRPIHDESGLSVLEDNVCLEFNFSPAKTAYAMLVKAWNSLDIINSQVLAPLSLQFTLGGANKFTAEQLNHPTAKMFGCDPDNDAYKEGAFRVPPSPRRLNGMRFAGGHIHIGFDKEEAGIPDHALVQFLDAYCLMYWRAHFSNDNAVHGLRRKYYGLPGLYRSKPYGIEYRTPCNFWLHGDSNGENFIHLLHKTVAGVLSDPYHARMLYDRTNWKQVQNVLSEGSWNNSEHVALVNILNTGAKELWARGEHYIGGEEE